MADAKISALPAATTPLAGTEVLPIVQSGVTKKVSVGNLTTNPPSSTFAALPSASTVSGQIYYVSNVGQNGSLWQSNGTRWVPVGPVSLCSSSIPFILVPSGSVSAAGAISGFTLDKTYPAAYCYFPANILAASIAAGWHYCVFSSTTAGTAYLNTYTSGVPTIPASLTPVTAGQGAYTAPTGADIAAQVITVPANTMGINGQLRVLTSQYNNASANNKTYVIKYSGAAGTTVNQVNGINQNFNSVGALIVNQGVTNVQYGATTVRSVFGGVVQGASVAADTTADTSVAFVLNKATATDYMIIASVNVELYSQ